MSGGGGGSGAMMGGYFQAVGSLMEANEIDSAYKDQAHDLDRAAQATRNNAEYNAKQLMIQAGKKIGGMSADYAASGISSDSGSVLDVIAGSHANAELDRLNIKHEGDLKAFDYERRATRARSSGDAAMQMGYFNAFASVFGGGVKASQMSGDRVEKVKQPSGNNHNSFRRGFDDDMEE